MNIVIPPLVFVVVGIALIVAGTLRMVTLGRRNPKREVSDDDPARGRARRRHLMFGILWVGMGLFLLFSTAGVLRSRAAVGQDDSPVITGRMKASAGAPLIHLDPGRPTAVSPPAKP